MEPKEWKRDLEEWHSPQDFRDKLNLLWAEYGLRLLTQAGMTDLFRDAYPASIFALRRRAEKVRLVSARRPDFEIELLGRKQQYEVVEADTPGRRRSDEINQGLQPVTGEALPGSFYLTPELAPQILQIAADRKDKDTYLPEWGLVIVLNPAQPGGEDQHAIENGMVQATSAVRDRFAEVWVLWEGTAYNTWQGSVPGDTIIRPLICEN